MGPGTWMQIGQKVGEQAQKQKQIRQRRNGVLVKSRLEDRALALNRDRYKRLFKRSGV